MRLVELRRERVVLRPVSRGIKTALKLPVAAYLGVAIRMEPPAGTAAGAVALVLEHPDPGLSLTLYRAADGTDIVAEWQAWGRTLGMPLLVAEADGRLREPFDRIGGVRVGPPISRRRRRTGRCPQHRSCIAAVARSSRAIEPRPAICHRPRERLRHLGRNAVPVNQ